ncbi:hypothetical protein D3C80_2027310 [compost metagenome]
MLGADRGLVARSRKISAVDPVGLSCASAETQSTMFAAWRGAVRLRRFALWKVCASVSLPVH